MVWTWERLGERDALHSNALKVCAVRAGACWTELLWAARNDNVAAVRRLAARGADVDVEGCW